MSAAITTSLSAFSASLLRALWPTPSASGDCDHSSRALGDFPSRARPVMTWTDTRSTNNAEAVGRASYVT